MNSQRVSQCSAGQEQSYDNIESEGVFIIVDLS